MDVHKLALLFAFIGLLVVIDAQNTFNVKDFGAVGDGKRDDAKAFESAWKVACNAQANNVILAVPGPNTFLLSPIKFEGPCKSPNINVVIQGTLSAPRKEQWPGKTGEQWLSFEGVNGLVVNGLGYGVIDGQGDSWWKNAEHDSSRPTALRFSKCNKLRVRGLTHKDSPMNHVSINGCNGADISKLKMLAPGESPNTDGIDISGSTNAYIHDTYMSTGDDCVAINGGCKNIIIRNLECAPGHGISVGSLGKNGKHEEVEGIFVDSCKFTRTQNGVRIKTWQGGSGFARNITFKNITFVEADNPLIINQYYCPDKKCSNKTSAVKISDVRFISLRGSSASNDAVITLNCSETVSCDDILLEDINIKPANSSVPNRSSCTNVRGRADDVVSPPLNCFVRS